MYKLLPSTSVPPTIAFSGIPGFEGFQGIQFISASKKKKK
jgi:hypothetical protein